jgi:hypothetical protein
VAVACLSKVCSRLRGDPNQQHWMMVPVVHRFTTAANRHGRGLRAAATSQVARSYRHVHNRSDTVAEPSGEVHFCGRRGRSGILSKCRARRLRDIRQHGSVGAGLLHRERRSDLRGLRLPYTLAFTASVGDVIRVSMYSPATPGYLVIDDVTLTVRRTPLSKRSRNRDRTSSQRTRAASTAVSAVERMQLSGDCNLQRF